MKIEQVILANLVNNEIYMRKVLPFLTREYFSDSNEKVVFDKIVHFINQYNALPDQDALIISVQNDKKIAEMQYAQVVDIIHQLEPTDNNLEWLIVESEKFCKDKALYNAILESISLIDEKNSTVSKDGIPSILQAALGVCFDTNIGHDYIDNAESRYDFYHQLTTRIPFDLELLNKITNGGMPNKTLNIILAGTGAGKSLFMCHQAAACLTQGKNVLYITLEMAEERIAERIDANLMNITLDQLREIPRAVFDSRIEKIRNKTEGRLIIKEYPTAGAHVGHFKGLLTELSMKRSFKPDIIIVDYLNICTSSRYKGGSNVNSYTIIKSIAEELRGLAVEMNVPILSATQTTRGGFCLDLNTVIETPSGKIAIKDIKVGDMVLSNFGWNTVKTVFSIKDTQSYLIKTKSGKEIICSGDHKFPIGDNMVEKSINNGLLIGDKLFIK